LQQATLHHRCFQRARQLPVRPSEVLNLDAMPGALCAQHVRTKPIVGFCGMHSCIRDDAQGRQ
jgi:hypothetical protein